MKYALINKDQIKVIFAALQIGVVKDKKDQIILAKAIGIMKSLKPSEPVARVNSEGFIVELGLGLSSGTKLYALDEVTK